jgi:hypothetical protein
MKNYMLGMGASKKSMFKSRVFKHLIPQLTQNKLKQLTVGSGVQRRASDLEIEERVEMAGEGAKRRARPSPLKFKF